MGRGGWLGGIVLILIGIFFLLGNYGLVAWQLFDNWWALFILIPALGALGNAWRTYQMQGRFTDEVFGSLLGSLLLLCISLVFLLNLEWGRIWPIFLILGGLGILLRGRFET